jgi:nanoRNase/pAp phosphatase (c-di-AMP/oligoRNAs hydrolase)
MVPFAKMANGKWKVSLYSTKPEIDCGAIAKTFGGGGHYSAAGFVCNRLPWESVIENMPESQDNQSHGCSNEDDCVKSWHRRLLEGMRQ